MAGPNQRPSQPHSATHSVRGQSLYAYKLVYGRRYIYIDVGITCWALYILTIRVINLINQHVSKLYENSRDQQQIKFNFNIFYSNQKFLLETIIV